MRQYWLGVLSAVCLLVPVAVAAVVVAAGGDGEPASEQTAASESPDPAVESEAERLREASQTRDKQQVEELTAQMRRLVDDLDPVVRGIARTLPPDDGERVGPLASRADVREWRRTTGDAQALFAETVSGDTGTNVARGALAAAVRGLAETVETYELALARPATRAVLLERVRAQRDNAMDAWQTAATQIDVVNIAVGLGHQHPGSPGGGVAPPDQLPEGTDAAGGG